MNNSVPRYLDLADINENKPVSSFNRQNSRMNASRYVNCLPSILPSSSFVLFENGLCIKIELSVSISTYNDDLLCSQKFILVSES